MPEAKPIALPVSPDAIPAELRARQQWVCWRYEYQRQRHPSKPWTEVPRDPATGANAKSTDATTWGTFEHALARCHAQGLDGVGFVVTREDPYVGIDLDGCRDPDTGEIHPWAQAIVDRLTSYTEVSPSGTGLHIFVRGQLPPDGRKKGAIEVYNCDRYLTVTGCSLADVPSTIEERHAELERWHAEVFRQAGKARADAQDYSSSNGLGASSFTDEPILGKARRAANADKFRRLWAGDIREYPSPSEADLALCSLLAFWTRDPAQIDRLFRQCSLYRPKWDEQHGAETYGAMTVRKALETVTTYWTPKRDSHGDSEAIHLTDWGNAQRLIREFGQDLHYVHPWKKWLHWNGRQWEADGLSSVEGLAKRVIADLFHWAARQVHAMGDELKEEPYDER